MCRRKHSLCAGTFNFPLISCPYADFSWSNSFWSNLCASRCRSPHGRSRGGGRTFAYSSNCHRAYGGSYGHINAGIYGKSCGCTERHARSCRWQCGGKQCFQCFCHSGRRSDDSSHDDPSAHREAGSPFCARGFAAAGGVWP